MTEQEISEQKYLLTLRPSNKPEVSGTYSWVEVLQRLGKALEEEPGIRWTVEKL